MSKEIIEGNKLIAEFMGAINETGYFQASTIGKTKVPTGRMYMTERFPDNMHLCSESDLRYHSSWDWLMPVVEKIEAVLKDETLFAKSLDANLSILNSNHASIFSPREIVWEYVIQFITWYNQQNT